MSINFKTDKLNRITAGLLVFSMLLIFASCVKGISVSYYTVRLANDPASVLVDSSVRPAYKEMLTYYNSDGTENYMYSVYTECSNDVLYGYNIYETDGDTSFYAYEGELYSEKNGTLYAIIQAFGTYKEYISSYLTFDCGLDSGTFYQLYSEKYSDGIKEMTRVAYHGDVTAETVAKFPEFFSLGDEIVVVYEIAGDYTAKTVSYYCRKNGDASTDRKLLVRAFEYYDEKQKVFDSVPDMSDTVEVSITYYAGTENETSSLFDIPKGCGIGIDTAGKDISFYYDSEMTLPFSYVGSNATDGLKIYAVYN